MARFIDFQTNFSTGELDPLLRSRVDIPQYANALAKATNVIIQPQGGARRRPGTKHIFELPNSSTPSVANGVRLISFEFSVDDSYMLCFVAGRMYVVKSGALITNINGSGNDYLAVASITGAMLSSLSWTQSADTLIVVHPDLQPIKIVRGATDASWTATTITFDSIPKYAFAQTFNNPVSLLTPSGVSGNVVLTSQVTGTAQAGTASTITLDAAASEVDDIYANFTISITDGTGSGQSKTISSYVGSTKVATVSSNWTTTPDNTSKFRITKSVFHDGRSSTAQAGTASTITLDASASAAADIYNGSTITITGGTGSGQIRIISNYVGSTKVATVSSNWTTTPDSTSQFTITSQVDQYINVSPQGRARISKYISATSVEAIVEFPFFNTQTIASGDWELETGYENVWSSARGWPRSVSFHEGRLYFGGAKSRPSTIWGSKVALFFDFKPSEFLDDDAVEATLDTNQLNIIVDIISGRDLQVFTTGGEFYVPQQGTDPITPLTFTFKQVSRNGTKTGTRVEALESGSLFIQKQGKALNEFLFSDTQLTYISQRISLLSGHLLKNPSRMSLRRATSTDEGDLLLLVNATDGSMAVYSVLRSQQIVAPSEFTTDGEFLDVNVDVTQIYTVVKRVFNGTTRYFVELFSNDRFTDCAFTGGVASTATGLPHIGKSLNVICDGVPQGNETVSAGGSVTFDRASTTNYEVGLPITVYLKTMPVEVKLQSGTRIGFKKRIVEVNVIVNESQHLNINNQPVPFQNLDNPLLDIAISPFTGIKRLNGIRGYSRDAVIEVTQTLPLKLTLLGLEYKVAVNQGT